MYLLIAPVLVNTLWNRTNSTISNGLCLSVCLSVFRPLCLSVCLSRCLSVCLSVCPSPRQSIADFFLPIVAHYRHALNPQTLYS